MSKRPPPAPDMEGEITTGGRKAGRIAIVVPVKTSLMIKPAALCSWGSDRTDMLRTYFKYTALPIWIYTRETENKSSNENVYFHFAQNLKGASIGRQLNLIFTYLSVCVCVCLYLCVRV